MDFDWGEIGKILGSISPILFFVIFNILFRKQQERRRQETTVKSLILEIEYNQKLVESFSTRWQIKRFKTRVWDRNKNNIDFIEDQILRSTLAEVHTIIQDFNRDIEFAKKHKSTSYLTNIRVERLVEPLNKAKVGLEEWVELRKTRKEVTTPVL